MMSEVGIWIDVCPADDLEEDEALTFNWNGKSFAVYRTTTGLYATDGICTHQYAFLSDGLVMDDVIECPLHQGRFHIPTGKALSSPACVNLKTYPVDERNGRICINLHMAETPANA
jgi:3-phenylpropionate/trans-cinnamate dioxygenase ferredoxin subunit